MESTLIILSIPIFLAFMGAELLVARRRGRHLYRFADSIANLGNGIGEQIIAAFAIPITVGVYAAVFARWRVDTLSSRSIAAWIASSSSTSRNGLVRNSSAPAFIARTVIGTSACPLMKITGSATPVFTSSS